MTIGERDSHTRRDDYETSKQGARDVAPRAPNQRVKLLLQYRAAGADGLTDEEAAEAAGMRVGSTCWWRRCTDLRADGFIEQQIVEGEELTRKGDAGTARIVCSITEPGRAYLQAHRL